MLIKHSLKPTNYCLPVTYCKNGCCRKILWFYESEVLLWKAYNQLKKVNCCYKPLYPVVYENLEDVNL